MSQCCWAIQAVSSHLVLWTTFFGDRSKNFEKSGEYATAWKKDEDGKMGVDGPRVVVGDQSQVPQAGIVTRSVGIRLTGIFSL